jgi:Icc-related predicted phosphoesterase
MKIWHISDTHNLHEQLKIPDVDMVVHSGDFANSRNQSINNNEVLSFLDWFAALKIKHKVLIAGNHDVSIQNRLVTPESIRDRNIHYLENSSVVIDSLTIWGSPITPSYGEGWAFNLARHKMSLVWERIPVDADIIITHGPPKGILDLNQEMEMCGCKSLFNRIQQINPILSLFGHVHSNETTINAGARWLNGLKTMFSNGSVVNDGKLRLVNNGSLINI